MDKIRFRYSLSPNRMLSLRWMRESFSTAIPAADSLTETHNDHADKRSEDSWRRDARRHSRRIRTLLAPGLTPIDHPLNTGLQRQRRRRQRSERESSARHHGDEEELVTALDPQHPVYNFLIEYYGLKGTKGVRSLLKWPPGISAVEPKGGGILLEGATEQDFFATLHAKGAILCNNADDHAGRAANRGLVHSPFQYVYGSKRYHPPKAVPVPLHEHQRTKVDGIDESTMDASIPASNGGPLASFLWYRSLLQRTLDATPVLHCYGLHEWAMQYHPEGVKHKVDSNPPPSSKYQSHLKLRIDRDTLNRTVESNTLFCTHVDAWKFFAKEALPRNQFYRRSAFRSETTTSGASLPERHERPTWLLRSEQPACVHTTMDLLKIALKLGPFCNPELLCRTLALTIEARTLDVAASPYDVTTDYGIKAIAIETPSGRSEYKRRQMSLMNKAGPIRRGLLENYGTFLLALDQ